MRSGSRADPTGETDPSERLDGWKEIAAHLKRDVRTLQRWEKSEGLPIHRHAHKQRASVYAYVPELNAWWNNRRTRLEASPVTRKRSWERTLPRAAVLVASLFALVAIVWTIRDWSSPSPARSFLFQERDWLLIGAFENRTGEPLLDGTLEYALTRELANSRYVNVVPRPRIEDALRLMRKSPDTQLDVAVGREVCLRDGAIRALLTGRIERIDPYYLLSVQLVDPKDGKSVAAHSEEAAEKSQLLSATQRLASWARKTLGEAVALIRESEESLERVTTPSLKALQLFSQADALERQGKHGPASQLLKSALIEDPEFAAAHTWLAWTIANQGGPSEEYMVAAQRGVELMLPGEVSERERYIIQGSYPLLAALGATSPARDARLAEAVPIWEALVERYPEDYWGNNNLLAIYHANGSLEYFRQFLRLAKLRPNDFYFSARAATIQIRTLGDPVRARPWVRRARELVTPEVAEQHPQLLKSLEQTEAFEGWLKGDLEEALKLSNATVEGLRSRATVNEACFVLGRHRDIETVGDNIDGIRWDWVLAAYNSWVGRAPDNLHRINPGTPVGPAAIFALVRSGRPAEAARAISRLNETWGEPYKDIFSGELARVEGRTLEAVSRLRKGLDRFLDTIIGGTFFLGAESLAWIHQQQGDQEKAIQVLKRASQTRKRCLPLYAAGFWLRNEWLLAQLYRKAGHELEAREIEERLRHLLAYADRDHPILIELQIIAPQ